MKKKHAHTTHLTQKKNECKQNQRRRNEKEWRAIWEKNKQMRCSCIYTRVTSTQSCCICDTTDLNDCELIRTRVIFCCVVLLNSFILVDVVVILLPLLSVSFVDVGFFLSFCTHHRCRRRHSYCWYSYHNRCISTHADKIDRRRKWYYVIVEEMTINCKCIETYLNDFSWCNKTKKSTIEMDGKYTTTEKSAPSNTCVPVQYNHKPRGIYPHQISGR